MHTGNSAGNGVRTRTGTGPRRPLRANSRDGRSGHIGLRIVRDYRQYYYGSSELTIVHPQIASRSDCCYWLSVVFWPVMVIITPRWVTLTLWIDIPAGSFGTVVVKLTRLPRTLVGMSPADTTRTLN
jgi:hypothetical protein